MQPGFRFSLSLCFLALLTIPAAAQTVSTAAQSGSVAAAKRIDESRRVTLRGTVHPLAQAQYDRGAVPDAFPAERMLVLLRRPAEREAALQKFLREVHAPGSSSYHRWVTPEEFGARFGAADENIAAVSGWLQSHGFFVPRVSKSRNFIEFSGTAAQVREALRAEIHQYEVNGATHYSIANEISIPETLAPLIRGFAPLNNFELDSYVHTVGSATYSRATRRATPLLTTTLNNQNFYAVAPEDFATQYNLGPLYNAGTNGAGQTIGIIGGANIDLSLVAAHRTLFGLPASNVQVVIDGEDPGPPASPNVEGFLDVEVSGAVAPKATVNFYIAGGTHFQSLIPLATLRAIEDNQASILSASFGECEQLLGNSGNQFWSSLWEQAAAQGQTVFVSSGDSGPSTCPLVAVSTPPTLQVVSFGLSVNGLSSTPWNVSVGGTDFFYSDYATGAPSAATLWNATNDPSFGSLKAPLPEQVWDDQVGLNAMPASTTSFSIPSAAGGGGASNCAQSTGAVASLVCTAGYAKPAWQNAPGVPSDGVRDLPDVSLFAANGRNFSAYPICAEPGDCAPVTAGEPQVLLVGGTSASSPAMAGILALVNQKTGQRQGQANFTLYALARQQPGVFHDVTLGTNDVLCQLGLLDCNIPYAGSTLAGSYGVYAAGAGYDLASGLGSVDANALVTQWNTITFLPTSTTLQLSPSTVVHGSPVSVTASVTSPSASAVSVAPSGDVDIATAAAVPLPQSGAIPLSGGTANASIGFFPGGSYQVTAQYAGDGVFGASASTPVSLTVTPEPSTTSLDLRYTYIDWSATPVVGHSGTVANGGQVPASSQLTFEAQPTGVNSQSTGEATGTATFTDGATSAQVPLNSAGVATWSPQGLSIGVHSVTVSYSGDSSYNASTAGPLTFTVTKGIPRLGAGPIEAPSNNLAPPPMYPVGSTLHVEVFVGAQGTVNPPTGSVTVNLGQLTQTVALTPFTEAFSSTTNATGLATFTSVPAGTYTLSASYAGDSNWNSAAFTDATTLTFATPASNPISTTTTLTVSPSAISANQSVTLTANVTPSGMVARAVGPVEFLANGVAVAFGVISSLGASTPNTVTVSIPGEHLPIGNVQMVAIFQGLGGLAASTSAPVSLTVTPADFSLSMGASRVLIKSGASGTIPLLLGGPNGGTVALSLACLPSSNQIGCSVSPSSPSVNGNTSATLTINAFVPGTTAANFALRRNSRAGFFAASACFAMIFGVVITLPLPRSKQRAGVLCGLALFALATFLVGCGGGSGSITPPPPPNVNAPPGSYSVVVTGTSSGVIHNAKLTVIVQ